MSTVSLAECRAFWGFLAFAVPKSKVPAQQRLGCEIWGWHGPILSQGRFVMIHGDPFASKSLVLKIFKEWAGDMSLWKKCDVSRGWMENGQLHCSPCTHLIEWFAMACIPCLKSKMFWYRFVPAAIWAAGEISWGCKPKVKKRLLVWRIFKIAWAISLVEK